MLPQNCERQSTPFRPSKPPPLSILYSGVSWGLPRWVFSSPIQEPGTDQGGGRGLIRQGPLFPSAPSTVRESISDQVHQTKLLLSCSLSAHDSVPTKSLRPSARAESAKRTKLATP